MQLYLSYYWYIIENNLVRRLQESISYKVSLQNILIIVIIMLLCNTNLKKNFKEFKRLIQILSIICDLQVSKSVLRESRKIF